MYHTVCDGRYDGAIRYAKLLRYLYSKPFRWSIENDANRAYDGLYLRYQFSIDHHVIGYPNENVMDILSEKPCSVLEMMYALAQRMEGFMSNEEYGDRTVQWFWHMVQNLGLGSMIDDRYRENIAELRVERLLDRAYAPSGYGGLFTVKHPAKDMRDVEIWYQMCWYLDEFAGY